MKWSELYTADSKVDWETIGAYIQNPIWEELTGFLDSIPRVSRKLEYSRCTMMPGWNVKYRKGGRAVCTIYPDEHFFTCMIVIGGREASETEFILSSCTPYIQDLYRKTQPFRGSRWLVIEVADREVMEDVKNLAVIRAGVCPGSALNKSKRGQISVP